MVLRFIAHKLNTINAEFQMLHMIKQIKDKQLKFSCKIFDCAENTIFKIGNPLTVVEEIFPNDKIH